jgi:hypothetical protein
MGDEDLNCTHAHYKDCQPEEVLAPCQVDNQHPMEMCDLLGNAKEVIKEDDEDYHKVRGGWDSPEGHIHINRDDNMRDGDHIYKDTGFRLKRIKVGD